MDNSPYWDTRLAAMAETYPNDIPRPDLMHADTGHRPSNGEYSKYLYLAARYYRDHDCDDADTGYPFQFEDPAFNALWARSELALAEIAQRIGLDTASHHRQAQRIADALSRLWSPELGCYVARDTVSDEPQQPVRTIAGIAPLLVPGLPHEQDLLDLLRGPHFALGTVAMVPSHDLLAPTFDPARYWRGPSWFNTAWLIAEALWERGLTSDAAQLSRSMEDSALAHGFPEIPRPVHDGATRHLPVQLDRRARPRPLDPAGGRPMTPIRTADRVAEHVHRRPHMRRVLGNAERGAAATFRTQLPAALSHADRGAFPAER
ncbi:inositol monophosphatase [Leifsonia xyli subsp. cynodontis DSM 46306]|uniref:Mannosylglycerate hydrolase MGH1-like glycoside hydrolase domain-containing protein n=2 Tax=Leifsonia xyli TaxID=1575 RepID=U3P6W5_LEIXC|nr:inositol monophosphatase [Leifsonia xyli]AGW42040.1 inositol monophosphatase [Leifsonia xyli subsp. cynodontis DSM 46306]